jgi:hypothetical protein
VLTSSNSTGPEVKFEIKPKSVDRRAGFGVRFDPRGKLRVVNRHGDRVERAELTITTYTAKGTHEDGGEIKVRRGQGRTIRF